MSTVLLLSPEVRPAEAPRVRRKRRLGLWFLGAWVLSGIYLVGPDQQAVLTRWGAVTSPRVLPGLHYAFPWPIDQVYKLKVRQLRRTVIGGDVADITLGRLQAAASEFLSGDQNLLNVRAVAQYSVSEPRDFLFQITEADRMVAAAIESELSRRIARTAVDDILTTEKIAIQNDVLYASQRSLDEYRAGVVLSSINIELVTPPSEAADAFRAVAGARADALRLINEAQGYANDLLPRARGGGEQLRQGAQADKEGRINRALGDAARFEAVAAEYAKAPGVTGARAYLEAMEQILPKLRKLVVDSNRNLDLTVIRKDDNAGASQK